MLGLFKANSDANLQSVGWWGLGSVIRNDPGLVMAIATWRIKGANDVMMAEVFALLLTVRIARDFGFRHMVFEVDNDKMVRMAQKNKIDNISYLGKVIYEIGALKSSSDTCHFRYISWNCNEVAHTMAQLAHSSTNKVWIEEVPLEVQEVYYHDILI